VCLPKKDRRDWFLIPLAIKDEGSQVKVGSTYHFSAELFRSLKESSSPLVGGDD
jgi:hypothetical protein